MKIINWTKELQDKLLNSKSVSAFISEVDNIGYKTALKKKKELLGIKDNIKKEKKIIKDTITKIEKEINEENKIEVNKFEYIDKVIVDIEKLIKEGVTFYINNSRNEVSNYDKTISDLRHLLESNYDTMENEELIRISKEIGNVCRKRRLYKNEIEFLTVNKSDCQSFINFINSMKEYSKTLDDRIYNTRILKEQIGNFMITSKNNSRLNNLRERNLELENKVKELEIKVNNSQMGVSEETINRLYTLEQANLKETRRKKREKGEKVSIDYLKPNWRDLFQKELDPLTKNGVINDCYAKYSGINIKKIRDLDVWERILPDYLYEKKWFLKTEK